MKLYHALKNGIRGLVVVATFSSLTGFAAVPTAEEIKAARPRIELLTKNDYKALKEKTKSEAQVGDALMEYVENEDKAPAKFLLLQDAFGMYVKAKVFDKAEATYSKAQADCGTEYALEVAKPWRSKLGGFANSKNPAAKELKARIDEDEKGFKQVRIVKAQLKKNPGDESLCEKLGFEYAAIGDWYSALAAFQTAPGEFAKIADWELGGGKGGDYTAAKVAEYWWKLADDHSRRRNVFQSVRLHAAMWYRTALDQKAFKGNDVKIIENLIAETEGYKGAEAHEAQAVNTNLETKEFDLGKGVKVEFVKCPAGTFRMGWPRQEVVDAGGNPEVVPPHDVVISKPFWISKYPVTFRLYSLLTNGKEMEDAVKRVKRRNVYRDFLAVFAERLGSRLPKRCVVRLPTEAEREYAMKAGGSGSAMFRKYDLTKQEKTKLAEANSNVRAMVPNGWGICGFRNGVAEMVEDLFDVREQDRGVSSFKGEHYYIGTYLKLAYAPSEKDPVRRGKFGIYIKDNGPCEKLELVEGQLHIVLGPELNK